MAKSYSEKYLISLGNLNDKRIGVQFGKLCVKANLPPGLIADAMGVSRMSVYNWFRGKVVNQKNVEKVEHFMDILEDKLESGALPVPTMADAKKFITTNIINKI